MPTSDETYGRLHLFLRELYQILDSAVSLAVADCVSRSRPIDKSFIAAYVRDETKGRLRELRGTHLACSVKSLNNGGVQAIYDGCALRVRKEKDGGLPATKSEALRLYYEQTSISWNDDDVPEAPPDLNLVVLWDFDMASRSLASVDLVMPYQWRIGIPHPAVSLSSGPDTPPVVNYQDVDVEFSDEDDIDLEGLGAEEADDEEGVG